MSCRRAKLFSSPEGDGSITATGPTFPAAQPRRRALPIRPAPTSRVTGRDDLGLADTLQHGCRDRLFRRFAAPEYELESWIIVLAGFDREIEQRFALG